MDSTPLRRHKKIGKRLIPPIAGYGWKGVSWQDDRLPEMIWAALLLTGMDRLKAIELLRSTALKIRELPNPDQYSDTTISGLASIPEAVFVKITGDLLKDAEARTCLAGLLILEGLPGKDRWEKLCGDHRISEDDQGEAVMKAVVATREQQSETSTDCRWMRVLSKMMGGLFHFPAEKAQEIENYPNQGDLTEVRPSIRANEMMVDGPDGKVRDWPPIFWKEVWERTKCQREPKLLESIISFRELTTTRSIVADVYVKLCNHSLSNLETTGIEARSEIIFGIGLYSLTIADEILATATSKSVFGRLGLRTIVESYITMSYLLKSDTEEIWLQYRRFGAGQAKLARLKAQERTSQPSFLDLKMLEQIANEDRWEEFLEVKIGHWESTDLRTMAIQTGLKHIYDSYYEWTSTYSHAHWGALREHCFSLCLNPLHRLHRIPACPPKELPDVTPDLALLLDKILDTISNEYPVFPVESWHLQLK